MAVRVEGEMGKLTYTKRSVVEDVEKQIPCCLQPQRRRILVIVARSKWVAEVSQLKDPTRDQSKAVAFCYCSGERLSFGSIESIGAPDQKGQE
eukprot:15333437-Ditylum_brightwellii.AAC.1